MTFVLRSPDELKAFIKARKSQGQSIGFVPTMGALHEGHLTLARASKRENDVTVCSVFVNPAQFNNADDLKNYPRTEKNDTDMLGKVGCDAVFIPSAQDMYPQEKPTLGFDFGQAERVMEGRFRPGHFNGVGIIVSKLFNMVSPDKAYFGEKDFQQLAIIRILAKELCFGIDIIGVPTVRETDGLAMSSRNRRLTDEERQIAPDIYKILTEAKKDAKEGASLKDVKESVLRKFAKSEALDLEYFEIVNADSLQPIENWCDAERAQACVAAFLGQVRLIDNINLK
ncbi:pantothenate synthetase [Fulvitalea axinellae]|uniref:Pantothenate synthetase n=1 Tax=Fulvitalea axinellae TaxID=1182444 RepID=A0AAU9C6R2_9BACT|nr:pantothenate synthetase [Fulvitalea axinellae]